MPRSYPGSTPGIDPRSQGVIPRRFKRKKIFVTNELTNGRTHGWTDRRDGRNSDLDNIIFGPLLAPLEGLRAPELPGVNPWGLPQQSGGDSKAI